MKNYLMINKRKELGYTQGCVAYKINDKVKIINDIESGKIIPDIHTAFKIAWVLEIPIEELFPIYRLSNDKEIPF